MSDLLLTPEETKAFIATMARARQRLPWQRPAPVAMHRALQFLAGGGRPYRCTAGESLITVLADGDIVPCRRMPIPVGNVKRQSMREVYQNSELLQRLRHQTACGDCRSCFYKTLCADGLRCLAYAVTGAIDRPDPGCWRVDELNGSCLNQDGR